MTIDTKDVTSWLKLHLSFVVPVGLAVLAWWLALRWQAAIDHNQTALMIFYFTSSAVSGITAAILIIGHLSKLGFFDVFN